MTTGDLVTPCRSPPTCKMCSTVNRLMKVTFDWPGVELVGVVDARVSSVGMFLSLWISSLLFSSSVQSVSVIDFLVNSVNTAADPCSDFFEYACTAKEKEIDKLQRIVDNRLIGSLYQPITGPHVTNKARHLFQKCANRHDIEENGPGRHFEKIERINQLNLYTPEADLDLTNLTIEAWRLMSLRPWFSYSMGVTNNSEPMMKIDYPEPFLKHTETMDFQEKQELRLKYINFLTRMFMYYVRDLHLPTKEDEVRQQVAEGVLFEESLFYFTNSDEPESAVETTTLDEVQKRFPLVNLTTFFKTFAPSKALPLINRNLLVELHVHDLYLESVTAFLRRSSEYILKTFIIMMGTREQDYELTGKYWELKNKFIQNNFHGVGVWPFKDREDACLNITETLFPQLVARIYVDNFFPEEIRKAARAILNNLITTFGGILEEAVWMDSVTKEYAMNKLESMGREVGYLDKLMNDTYLQETYQLVNIVRDDSFENVVRKVLPYAMRTEIGALLNPKLEMGTMVTSVDAFNFKDENHIVVPAVLLQPPFYHPTWPVILNYAGLGYTVGHEIGHSFDTDGRLHGLKGQVENWWTDETLKKYEERTECFVEQYSNFLMPEVNKTVNGRKTLNENLADNVGIRVAYHAYKQAHEEPRLNLHLSNDQLFFIMAIQMDCIPFKPKELAEILEVEEHAPPRARINIPLANMPEFAKAFNCPKDSPMNPTKRCRLF